MSPAPLTHHEILGLVEPFTRSGRHVDLAASDRVSRRLRFRPLEHADLHETLQLEIPKPGDFRLTRTLRHVGGLEASLQARGPDAGALLQRVESFAPQRQFRSGPGYLIALSHRIEAASAASSNGAAPTRTLMVQGEAQVLGLQLLIKVPAARGLTCDLTLTPAPGQAFELPQDLLAVLGWDWSRLDRKKTGWSALLRLRGREPDRSRLAEARLEAAAAHLARTLSEPPAQFHQRWLRARWVMVFRRSIPVLIVAALFGAALCLPYLHIAEGSVIQMLIFNVPPLLLVWGFCLQEMPRFEIPPLPRKSTAPDWRPKE
jgi:hypothetical protein